VIESTSEYGLDVCCWMFVATAFGCGAAVGITEAGLGEVKEWKSLKNE
jgi:hypothetical protein